MLNMKKDMGGAATALALAHMIMADGLKVRLRVIIPAVENAISGTSFRPRDISEIRMEKDFHELHREIWSVLKDEVMKGYVQSSQAVEAG